MAHRFGSKHTQTKLEALEEYLRIYTTALKNQPFRLIYFDAFAGTGDIQIADSDATLLESVDEYSPFVEGSVLRALKFGNAFHRYIFVDQDRAKVQQLERLRAEHEDIANRIEVQQGDANKELERFCMETDWKSNRAVVFLDPYGNHVSWETIETMANTNAIDLWYLFPAGLGVYRQISSSGIVHKSHEASLDRLFGTTEWRNAFIEKQAVPDLFGEREGQEKRATVESVTRFMADRMKTVFKGGVVDEWLPLGSRGIHMYSLMFAWANPDPKAQLAGKLARAVFRSKKHGRTKRH